MPVQRHLDLIWVGFWGSTFKENSQTKFLARFPRAGRRSEQTTGDWVTFTRVAQTCKFSFRHLHTDEVLIIYFANCSYLIVAFVKPTPTPNRLPQSDIYQLCAYIHNWSLVGISGVHSQPNPIFWLLTWRTTYVCITPKCSHLKQWQRETALNGAVMATQTCKCSIMDLAGVARGYLKRYRYLW